jgi:hypothetical protein
MSTHDDGVAHVGVAELSKRAPMTPTAARDDKLSNGVAGDRRARALLSDGRADARHVSGAAMPVDEQENDDVTYFYGRPRISRGGCVLCW